jgi:hypothetical protein
MVKVVPWPRTLAMSMRPPIAAMSFRTTSMPTPRPASSVRLSAVDRPEANTSCMRSDSDIAWSEATMPFSIAF